MNGYSQVEPNSLEIIVKKKYCLHSFSSCKYSKPYFFVHLIYKIRPGFWRTEIKKIHWLFAMYDTDITTLVVQEVFCLIYCHYKSGLAATEVFGRPKYSGTRVGHMLIYELT